MLQVPIFYLGTTLKIGRSTDTLRDMEVISEPPSGHVSFGPPAVTSTLHLPTDYSTKTVGGLKLVL